MKNNFIESAQFVLDKLFPDTFFVSEKFPSKEISDDSWEIGVYYKLVTDNDIEHFDPDFKLWMSPDKEGKTIYGFSYTEYDPKVGFASYGDFLTTAKSFDEALSHFCMYYFKSIVDGVLNEKNYG